MSTFPSPATPANPGNQLSPGDEAMPGTPGAGEDLCEDCGGKGTLASGRECPTCEGTGKVIRGVGGG